MFGYCEQIDFEEEHTGLADAIVESQILARCFKSHKSIDKIDFEEEHTGLADAIVESQILARCFKSHKSIDKKINRACWRIPQQAVA